MSLQLRGHSIYIDLLGEYPRADIGDIEYSVETINFICDKNYSLLFLILTT